MTRGRVYFEPARYFYPRTETRPSAAAGRRTPRSQSFEVQCRNPPGRFLLFDLSAVGDEDVAQRSRGAGWTGSGFEPFPIILGKPERCFDHRIGLVVSSGASHCCVLLRRHCGIELRSKSDHFRQTLSFLVQSFVLLSQRVDPAVQFGDPVQTRVQNYFQGGAAAH